MMPEQKIKHAILMVMVTELAKLPPPIVDASNIDQLYEAEEGWSDIENEFRGGKSRRMFHVNILEIMRQSLLPVRCRMGLGLDGHTGMVAVSMVNQNPFLG